MEDIEQLNSDVLEESSSETTNAVVENNEAEGAKNAEASQQQPKEDNVPFHEHPRFKELIEQKNAASKQAQALQARLEALEKTSKTPQAQAKEDALLARLKQIDPEFGGRFEKIDQSLSRIEKFEQWMQQQEQEKSRTQAVSTLESLHTQYKVSSEMKDVYQAMIQQAAAADPSLDVKDLPDLYKNIHERMSKYMDTMKRSDRESYVSDKRKDASAPTSQPRGKPATNAVKKAAPQSQDEDRASTVDEVLKLVREGKDI